MLIFRKFQIKNFDINNKMHTIYNLKRIKTKWFLHFQNLLPIIIIDKGVDVHGGRVLYDAYFFFIPNNLTTCT